MRVFWIVGVMCVVACDLGSHDPEPVDPTESTVSTACSGACHGAGGEASPPSDTLGRTDSSAVGVGAHAQHLGTSTWHKRVECGSCHRVPEQVGDPGHIDTALPAELTFGGMGEGAAWSHDNQTCTNSYCHGATLSNTIDSTTGSTAGGNATEPVWTKVDGSQAQCGSCHGAPPPAPHPTNPDCGTCHPTMNPGGGMVIAYPELHIDGHLDVVSTAACDSCHGASGQSAPPKDTVGNTLPSARGVGAHAQHLVANSPWHAPINCVECHKVPAGVNDQGHIDSPLPAELVFGPIAGAASTWSGTACTNTYCHGGGAGVLKGGAKTSPVWTQVDGSQSQCGSCHGAPPPAPHPTDSNCGSCHPTMNPGAGLVIAYPALHIDGKVDLINDQACDSCHGSGGNAAPPNDTTGGTTTDLRTVGAHRNHLAPSTWRKDIACDACHKVPAAVAAIGHIDTARPAELTFGPLAGNAVWNGATCSNTYCHGAGLGGGTSKNPVWTNVNGVQGQCGSCHGTPPPAPHPTDTDCGKCHDTMTAGAGLVITDPSRHIDGNLDVNTNQPCNSCHGGVNNAPPKDTQGNTATNTRGVGAHQKHLAATNRFKAIDCVDCHRVPGTVTAIGHIDTPLPAETTFSARAGVNTAFNGSRCSNNYCHGSTLTNGAGGAGGTATAPLWTTVDGSQAQCTSCHGDPPPLPHPQSSDCGQCHPNVQVGAPTTFSDPTKHIDGNVDVNGAAACNSCHGTTNNAPPKDTSGNTGTNVRGVGAHQAHVTQANWHRDIACADCHRIPSAVGAVGHIDTALPAELAFGGLAVGTAWNGSTCTSYCHGSSLGAGGSATAPLWTKVDGTQKQCASCHGNPPPAPHPQNPACQSCHQDAGATPGTFANPAQHIDGVLQVTAVHPAGYAARTAHGHEFDAKGSSTCATAGCHGTSLAGGNSGGPSCAKAGCHAVGAAWQTTCTFCHGTSGQGAPPAGVIETDVSPSSPHVGAHAKHVNATAMHTAWDCNFCHTKPSSALTPGHIDGTGSVIQAEVRYSTLNPAGTFATATSTCATVYCHGSGLPSGSVGGVPGAGTGVWTSTTALNCGSCHGQDPTRTGMSSEHRRSDHRQVKCQHCHSTVVDAANGIIAPTLHVNGVREAVFTVGTYNPATKSCTGTGNGCHGNGTRNGWR
ncbi:MAG: CxxxxCH/CxxCH domain-containing protein [Kofleriaceae bacterium]